MLLQGWTDVQTDGRTTMVDRLCNEVYTYVWTDGQTTAIDQSFVRQPRFGWQDTVIRGGELKDR